MAYKHIPTFRAIDLGFGFNKYTKGHIGKDGSLDVGSFPSYAAPAVEGSIGGGALGQLDLVTVEVDGALFSVGNDAKKSAGGQGRQLLEDSFFKSPQYIALSRGAMAYMCIPSDGIIDGMTVGLPLTVYRDQSMHDHLHARLTGEHVIPSNDGNGTRTITVKKINLIPQVVGSLIALSQSTGRSEDIYKERNLTIDVGYGTLLWLTSDGLKPIPARSNGNMGGVSRILQAMVQSMDASAMSNVGILDRLDRALLRNETSIKLNGEAVILDRHKARMNSDILENLSEMLRCIGPIQDIDNVFLTGGGTHLYKAAISKAFPNRTINCGTDDSQFTNVRGFQILAEVV